MPVSVYWYCERLDWVEICTWNDFNESTYVAPVEDPGVFTMPWSATITYGRNANQLWDERICAENVQHDYQYNYFSEKDAHLPTADKPDF